MAQRRAVLATEVDDLQVAARSTSPAGTPPSGRARCARRSCRRDSPQRAASRWMCVSTGNAGTPNAWAITTLAVLWPTPASASRNSQSARHLAAGVDDLVRPRFQMFLALVGREPDLADDGEDPSRGRARPSAPASSAWRTARGVTWLTFLSVVCADSTTATSSVNGSAWSSGIGGAGIQLVEDLPDPLGLLAAPHERSQSPSSPSQEHAPITPAPAGPASACRRRRPARRARRGAP